MCRSAIAHRVNNRSVCSTALLLTLMIAAPASRAEDPSNAGYSDDAHYDTKFTVCKHGCRYDKIQKAVDKASSGATILIGPGTYFENVVIDKNSVTLVGVSAKETTVDGRFRGPVFVLGPQNSGAYPGQISVTLTGLTITHGRGVTGGGIVQNVLTLVMTDSVIVSNVATQSGGGIEVQTPSEAPFIPPAVPATTIERCVIANNQAPIGAGIATEAEAGMQISDSLIAGNSGGNGAGVFVQYASFVIIVGTTISNNTASGEGGGISVAGGGPGAPRGGVELESSAIVNNTAAQPCGGVSIFPHGIGAPTCLLGSSGVVIALNVPGP